MNISKHAQQRARQRGIKYHYFDIILDYAEYIKKAPGKAFELRIRKRDKNKIIKYLNSYINSVKRLSAFELRIRKRDKDRIIKDLKNSINSIEKCSGKKLIVNQDMNTVITIY